MALKRKLKYLPVRNKLLAYNAIVRSKLEYAAEVWDPHHKTAILKLERLQRIAVRFIYKIYARHDYQSSLMSQNAQEI